MASLVVGQLCWWIAGIDLEVELASVFLEIP